MGLWWPVTNSGLRLTARPLPFQFTTTERALHGFTITSEDLSGVVNALTCYGLVSSEVSHLIATLVKRYVVHTENTDLHIPATR